MKISLPNEQAVIQDAIQILHKAMKPSEMVVLIARWWSDGGNYLDQKEGWFANENIDSLAEKIKVFEQSKTN
ncbi:hypothetical protein [Roseofilum sp. Guam]|uniref:hypothetical protein n=1 Tax=Roseofilum sp. Guam TaxID=2821502 RepID=UPI001B2F1CAA|nr:hypothetical protein [Roseofilum sp. Guam]MBP0029508.1 hypothetical protein [Roseofilum sp. Guam]